MFIISRSITNPTFLTLHRKSFKTYDIKYSGKLLIRFSKFFLNFLYEMLVKQIKFNNFVHCNILCPFLYPYATYSDCSSLAPPINSNSRIRLNAPFAYFQHRVYVVLTAVEAQPYAGLILLPVTQIINPFKNIAPLQFLLFLP